MAKRGIGASSAITSYVSIHVFGTWGLAQDARFLEFPAVQEQEPLIINTCQHASQPAKYSCGSRPPTYHQSLIFTHGIKFMWFQLKNDSRFLLGFLGRGGQIQGWS